MGLAELDAMKRPHSQVDNVVFVAFELIAVWDSSNRLPQVRPSPDLGADVSALSSEGSHDLGGWGLPIVSTLAANCGCTPEPTGGKWVWASLEIC
ncbi:hypothetical protein Acsp04_09820 [Actinomadura sp. NBRC 104425]|nr:hypothetical protein Acsp04_09820 [Actinomadura sp. NBRC 104425]